MDEGAVDHRQLAPGSILYLKMYAARQFKTRACQRRNTELQEQCRELEWESEALHVRAVDAEAAMYSLQGQLGPMGIKLDVFRGYRDESQGGSFLAQGSPEPAGGAVVEGAAQYRGEHEAVPSTEVPLRAGGPEVSCFALG